MHRKTQINTEKNFLINIFNFYVFSNLHVALATFCLVKITLLNIGISESKTAWFVFFSTLLSYNTIRFLRLKNINNWYNSWFKKNLKFLYLIVGVSFISILFLSFQLRLKTIILLIPFSLAILFYTFPMEKYSLRNIAGLKLFLIAFSWAGITVLFPLVQNYISLRFADYLTFIQRFIFVIVITIPFDIRDMKYDNSSLKTLPQQLGVSKTKIVGVLLIVLFIIIEVIKSNGDQSVWSTLIISIISGILLVKSTKNQSKYYSAFFVEALPILWFLIA